MLAEMVKCKACRILTKDTWHLGTNWLHKMGLQMSDQQLTEHMQAMCEITVSSIVSVHTVPAMIWRTAT